MFMLGMSLIFSLNTYFHMNKDLSQDSLKKNETKVGMIASERNK